MTPDQLALARRLVAHPRWRWVAGMVDDEMRLMGPEEVPAQLNGSNGGWICDDNPSPPFPMIPDLSDYATAAILLRMAMEAQMTGRRFATAESPTMVPSDGGWIISASGDAQMHTGHEDQDLGTVAATALLGAWDSP